MNMDGTPLRAARLRQAARVTAGASRGHYRPDQQQGAGNTTSPKHTDSPTLATTHSPDHLSVTRSVAAIVHP